LFSLLLRLFSGNGFAFLSVIKRMETNTTNKKVALVTGANKGIGLETARQLGKLGYTILVGARDANRGEAATQTLKSEGLDAHFVALDVTDAASIATAVTQVSAQFGHIDALVNNAGLGTFDRPATSEDIDHWRWTFETNVFGLVAVTNAFLPLVEKSTAGRIVNLTSILGSLGLSTQAGSPIYDNVGYFSAYGASKAAVNMYTVQLARELAPKNIKVNAAHPGWVKTELGGEGAMMEIEDGARTSVQLATLESDGPTGGYFHLGEPLPW
jgi:NAD(P)-dependent dehydrogenase (short-subunit alcohol dehydrogenase family)